MTKYDLFFSYNSQDHVLIEEIRTQLEKSPQQLNCFIDRKSLTIGKPWFDEIQDALVNSRAVAVFYGKNGLGRWQNLELMLAMDLQATDDPAVSPVLVIPILLPDADLKKAPRFLLLNTFLDLRSANWTPQLNRLVQTILGTDSLNQALKHLDSLPPNDVLRNPYRGLNYFEEQDAPLFFGREAIADKLLQKTKQCSLIALVGNSGTGKSSVVRAGLIPLLRKQYAPDPIWEVIVCIPADKNVNPFHNLAYAFLESWDNSHDEIVNKRPETEKTLRSTLSIVDCVSRTLNHSKAEKLLLIIDQFEELINFAIPKLGDKKDSVDITHTPNDFELFVELLLNAIKAPNCKVLLTIRGDYYGAVTEMHAGLAEKIEKGTVTLTRLADSQLKDIIEKPATLGGGQFQQGLPERIIHDVGIQPGNLALLEFALTALWNHQANGLLTLDAYENKVGKLEGAISKKADELLNDQQKVNNRELALSALTRLVRVSSQEDDGGDTRQRIPLLEFNKEERACLEPFIRDHLLVASGVWRDPSDSEKQIIEQNTDQNGSTLEVAHEALIRHWPTLQKALKGRREVLIWRQSIRKQFHNWLKHRDVSADDEVLEKFLLQGFYLSDGKTCLLEYPDALTQYEPEFITQSLKFEENRPIREWRKKIQPKYQAWQALNTDNPSIDALEQCYLQNETLAESNNWLEQRKDTLIADEPKFIEESLKFEENRPMREWRKNIQIKYLAWKAWKESKNDNATLRELEQCHLDSDSLKKGNEYLQNRQGDLIDEEPEFIKQSQIFAELRSWRIQIEPQYEQWLNVKGSNNHKQLHKYLIADDLLEKGLQRLKQSPEDLIGKEAEFIQHSDAYRKKVLTRRHRLLRSSLSIPLFVALTGLIYFGLLNMDTYSWQFAFRAIEIRLFGNNEAKAALHIPSMKKIPAGEFKMGSPEEEIKANSDRANEGPQHPVKISQEFFIGETEVTASEYKIFTDDIAAHHFTCKRWPKAHKPELDQGYWPGDKQPAINVSWNDASCYARWISFLTGDNYHLPSEAQWEYAARANTTGDYYWETDDAKKYAWFVENSGVQPHSVGDRDPNKFELRDISGNVWEWVQDCYAKDYKQAPTNGSASESKDCDVRVLRGGSWDTKRDDLRSADRDRFEPNNRTGDIGFRLAQD